MVMKVLMYFVEAVQVQQKYENYGKMDMNINVKNNFYDFLLSSMESLCVKQNFNEIPSMKCAVLIGTNRDDYMHTVIEQLMRKNSEVNIIILAKQTMLQNMNIKFKNIKAVITDEKYSACDYKKIQYITHSKQIDGFFFRGQNYNEIGNQNVLEIAELIYNDNPDLMVYGTDMDGGIYRYTDIKIYMDGIHLYNQMNKYIDEVLEAL